jgi:hypothetical protein
MKILTEDAVILCTHVLGRVANEPTQSLLRINGRRVLVAKNPEGKSISGCPNIGATIKPCQNTLPVIVGYSTFVSVDGANVCLKTVVGLTDGTPPGAVEYNVRSAGQTLVDALS